MKSVFKPVLLAALLAAAGFAAYSQTPAMGGTGAMGGMGDCAGMMGAGPMNDGMQRGRMGNMDPAKMQAWMDQRNAKLKPTLKLTPAQEGAWTTYTTAMKPPAEMMVKCPNRAEMDKLSTPERIDKMKALRTQHMADMTTAMEQRGEATKAFYATLTPEQQKMFDAGAMSHPGMQGRKGGQRDGKGRAQSY